MTDNRTTTMEHAMQTTTPIPPTAGHTGHPQLGGGVAITQGAVAPKDTEIHEGGKRR